MRRAVSIGCLLLVLCSAAVAILHAPLQPHAASAQSACAVSAFQRLTQWGCVQGSLQATYAVVAYTGIPFAQPPVGNLRWVDPKPPTAWSNVYSGSSATQRGCPQPCMLPAGLCPTQQTEDCLYLDITTPLNATPGASLPVMVFFAGGAYYQGTGFSQLYNASLFAQNGNVIVVTSNYRLGALGFLFSSDLSLAGNYGLADQRAVLAFVRDNIAQFGGNPSQVTIFGESAGAESVHMHLVSPLSQGLFSRAIAESLPALPLKTPSEATTYAGKLASDLGCGSSDLVCMRGVDASAIAQRENNVFAIPDPFQPGLLEIFYAFAPVVDGVVIPQQPMPAIKAGAYNTSIPLMIGSNSQEGVMFVYGALAPIIGNGSLDSVKYGAIVAAIFQTHFPEVLAAYHCPLFGTDCRVAMSQLLTDLIFTCPGRFILRQTHTLGGGTPTYNYLFNHTISDPAVWGANFSFCADATCHGAELLFVWDTFAMFTYSYTPAEFKLGAQMNDYWSSFARYGNPNTRSVGPEWPMWDSDLQAYIVLDTPSSAANFGNTSACDMWDRLGYVW